MKIVLLDVDGVLADFNQHLINQLRAVKIGLIYQAAADKVDAPRSGWDFKEHMTESEIDAVYSILKQPFTGNMPLIPGAKNLVEALREAGHKIVCVSSPWISNPTWEHDRRWWLKSELDIGHRDYISSSDKHLVWGNVLIDDKPSHIEAWNARHDDRGLLFDQFYNQDADFGRVGKMGTWSPGSVAVVLDHLKRFV